MILMQSYEQQSNASRRTLLVPIKSLSSYCGIWMEFVRFGSFRVDTCSQILTREIRFVDRPNFISLQSGVPFHEALTSLESSFRTLMHASKLEEPVIQFLPSFSLCEKRLVRTCKDISNFPVSTLSTPAQFKPAFSRAPLFSQNDQPHLIIIIIPIPSVTDVRTDERCPFQGSEKGEAFTNDVTAIHVRRAVSSETLLVTQILWKTTRPFRKDAVSQKFSAFT